MTIIE